MKSNDRFTWATEVLAVKPTDKILEVGCGVGLAIERIAPKLKQGSLTAIDRSTPMIEKAVNRNKNYILEKKVKVLKRDLNKLSLNGERFTKIFAFNVNLFWTNKSIVAETKIIIQHLEKNGSLYLFYQPPSVNAFREVAERVSSRLKNENFEIVDVAYEETVNSCCIISKPPKLK